MFAHLLEWMLQQRTMIFLLGILALIIGMVAWEQIPLDAFPDVTNVQVMVLTEAPGLAPLEVERQITFPIEIEMKGLPRVSQVRSLSKAGLSQVVVIFDDDVDIYFARQLVFEKLLSTKEELPEGCEPSMGPISTGLGEIYQYTVKNGYYCETHAKVGEERAMPGACKICSKPKRKSEYKLDELRTIQDWMIAPQLRKLRGVNEVNSFGGFVKQYHVLPDPSLLLKYDIALSEVMDAVKDNNANVGGGYITIGGEQKYIITQGFFQSIEDIENIVLNSQGGTPIYLKDVATIQLGTEPRQGAVTQDGESEVVIGMAIMLRGENSKKVVSSVIQATANIQKTLPPGVYLDPFYDRTSLIKECIKTMTSALFQGGILLIFVLFLLFWDLRASLMVALSLPLTAALTFICMRVLDMTADMMSLGGLAIALGVVVDAAIVVTTNIQQHLQQHPHHPRAKVACQAILEVGKPIISSVLVIVLVFVPLFSLESLEKKMFQPLGMSFCLAMLSSLVVALTVVAVAGTSFLKPNSKKNVVESYLIAIYVPMLKKVLQYPKIVLAVSLGLVIATAILIPWLGTEFLPTLDEGAIAVNIVRLPSASLTFSTEQSLVMEQNLRKKFSEIATIVSKSGRAEIAEDPMGPEQTDMFIMLKPYSTWPKKKSKAQLVEEIREEMLTMPGLKPAFSQPIALRVNELISGVKSDVAIKIFGEDLEKLKEIAEQIAPLLSQTPGSTDIKIEQISGFSQIEVRMNRMNMARHRINANDINAMISHAVAGISVTEFLEGEKRFAVVVRFPENCRHNIASLEQLLIPSPLGYHVMLKKLADVTPVEVPAQISREDGERRLLIECNIRGRDMGSFMTEVRSKIATIEDHIPTGYRLSLGGQFENQQRAMNRLMLIIPIVILLMFLLLLSTFQSLKSALFVLLGVPFAVVGGIWTLFLLQLNLSVSAMIGLIALLGMAVEASTVLVSFFRYLQERGLSVYEAVIEGTKLRLVPVLATNLTTVMGVLPVLLSSGLGSDLQRPLAAVIVGGLSAELILVLIVFPVVYWQFSKKEVAQNNV